MSLQREYCCLCGEVKPQVKFLYSDESLQFRTVMKINKLFNQILSISTYSSRSKFICSDCELSIHHFYKFWEMVQNVNKNLSIIHHNKNSQSSMIFGRPQIQDEQDIGLNLCHTTGITSNSKPVLIKISLVKQIQCGVCKTSLGTSQLSALHQVTHGLGTVLCQCDQCGHQDEIASFLQDNNNVNCPQCSFRKFHSVDVQTQFQSLEEPSEDKIILKNSSNKIKIVESSLQSLTTTALGRMEFGSSFPTPPHSAANNPSITGKSSLNSNSAQKFPTSSVLNNSNSEHFSAPSSVSNSDDDFSSSEIDFCASQSENYTANFYPPPSIFSSEKFTSRTSINTSTNKEFSSPSHSANINPENFPTPNTTTNNMGQFSSMTMENDSKCSQFSPAEHNSTNIFEDEKCNIVENSVHYSSQNDSCDEKTLAYSGRNNTCDYSDGKKTRKRGEKLHACDVCSRVFNHKGHLKRHMLVHNKSIKQFLCEECGMRFNQKSTLVTHWTSIHCKDGLSSKFSCVISGQIYKHKMNLLAHLLNNHNHTQNKTTHSYNHTSTTHNQSYKNTPLNHNHDTSQIQSHSTPHNDNHTQKTPQNNNHIQNIPQNNNHIQTIPQNNSHIENTPQNNNHIQNIPQNDSLIQNIPQNDNHNQNTPRNDSHTQNTPQYNHHTQIIPQNDNHTQNTAQNHNHTQNTPQNENHTQKNLNTLHPRLTTRFYCPPCDKYFISTSRLNAHSKVHKQRKVN